MKSVLNLLSVEMHHLGSDISTQKSIMTLWLNRTLDQLMSLKRDYEQDLDKMNCTFCCSQILQPTSAISDEGIFGFEVVSCGCEKLLVKRFADYSKIQIYFFPRSVI